MLTLAAYARSYGLMIVAAMLGATMSTRQIELHILPGDAGYGDAVLGLHLYTWALDHVHCCDPLQRHHVDVLLPTLPVAPSGNAALWISRILVWAFIIIITNVVLIFAEEGFHCGLPDDPTGYRLLNPNLPS